jgi:hypothetical protein
MEELEEFNVKEPSEKTRYILETELLRYGSAPPLVLSENDKLRGSYFIKYNQGELKFHQRMFKATKEEETEMYSKFARMDNETFLPEIVFHTSVTFKNEPILYLSQTGILACLEALCWAIYIPFANKQFRSSRSFFDKVCLLYDLVEFRMRQMFDFRNNDALLDSLDYVVKFGESNCSVNMPFLQIVGAYLDQVYLTIHNDPFVERFQNKQEVRRTDVSEAEVKHLYDTYLEMYEFGALIERFNEYYARLTVSPADYYAHQIKLKLPCFIPGMVLTYKNDRVFKQFEDATPIEEYLKNPLFIDFVFWMAYKQVFLKEIEFRRCRLLDFYIHENNVIYENLASLIYDNFFEKLFEDANKSKNLFEYNLTQEEQEANLQFMYPPPR